MKNTDQAIADIIKRLATLEAVAIMEAPETFKTIKFLHSTAEGNKPTAESKALSLSIAAFPHGASND